MPLSKLPVLAKFQEWQMDCQVHKLGLPSHKPVQQRTDKVQPLILELLVFQTELLNIQIHLPTRLQFTIHHHLNHQDTPLLLAEVTISSSQTQRLGRGGQRELLMEMMRRREKDVMAVTREDVDEEEEDMEEDVATIVDVDTVEDVVEEETEIEEDTGEDEEENVDSMMTEEMIDHAEAEDVVAEDTEVVEVHVAEDRMDTVIRLLINSNFTMIPNSIILQQNYELSQHRTESDISFLNFVQSPVTIPSY